MPLVHGMPHTTQAARVLRETYTVEDAIDSLRNEAAEAARLQVWTQRLNEERKRPMRGITLALAPTLDTVRAETASRGSSRSYGLAPPSRDATRNSPRRGYDSTQPTSTLELHLNPRVIEWRSLVSGASMVSTRRVPPAVRRKETTPPPVPPHTLETPGQWRRRLWSARTER